MIPMDAATILYAVGWVSLGILLLTLVVGDILDFFDFDFLDNTLGPTVAFGFLAVGGFVGGFTDSKTDLPLFTVLLISGVAGVIFGIFVMKLMSYFKSGTSGEVSEGGIVGHRANVVLTIPAAGYGKVKVNNSGHTMELAAKNMSGEAILAGTVVTVAELDGPGTVVVEPLLTVE